MAVGTAARRELDKTGVEGESSTSKSSMLKRALEKGIVRFDLRLREKRSRKNRKAPMVSSAQEKKGGNRRKEAEKSKVSIHYLSKR